jgi:predicted lipoprotein with Yx(FWY)xxD motif
MRSFEAGTPRRFAASGFLAAIVLLVVCATSAGAPPGRGEPEGREPAANPSGPATVGVRAVTAPAVGKVLVDSGGMTLYTFRGDNPLLYQFFQGSAPSCYEFCAEFWPPLLTTGAPTGTGGVDGRMLGTVSREDGTTQVTYDGHPLYRCSEDTQPGEANGEDIEMFDDAWYATNPDGEEA